MAQVLHRERTHKGIVGWEWVKRKMGKGIKVEVREPIYKNFTAPAYIQETHTHKTVERRRKNKVARQSRKTNAQRNKRRRWGKNIRSAQ